MPPRRGPRRRGPATRSPATGGGQPLTLPLVATVGVTAITADTAAAIGSINPQGLVGSWWFAYGSTPALGTNTGSTAVAATSVPQTVTMTLTGLNTGEDYWVALAGQTAAGTVVSAPVTFTPNTPSPVVPAAQAGTPAVSTPHFQWPFTINTAGANVVEQGSYDEVLSCVQAIVACPVGACPELPLFGRPDPTFQPGPPDAAALVAAIQQLEPRANEDVVVQATGQSGGDWAITLTTTVAGTGQ